ncbi:MAG: AtpZ/AtpI family protein [Proteobacteria bacterium]|nr:AtpZ/AtpI family protein [Pseudomonadota bacterium]MBU1742310.1 AtpZ/AtpI family protein [Pseudomonadota bacterium]
MRRPLSARPTLRPTWSRPWTRLEKRFQPCNTREFGAARGGCFGAKNILTPPVPRVNDLCCPSQAPTPGATGPVERESLGQSSRWRGGRVKPETREYFRILARASSMGLAMVLATVIGLVIGYFLDELFGTFPWLMMIFFGFGIVAGFRNLYILLKRTEKAMKQRDDREKDQ